MNDFQQLQVLHAALMVGAVAVCVVLGLVMSREGAVATFTGWSDGLLLIAAIVMAAEVAISYLLWRSRQASIPISAPLFDKWMHYRSSCILRWACLEGGILIAVLLSYLEQNPAGFSIAAIGLGFLFLARPSREYFVEHYGPEE